MRAHRPLSSESEHQRRYSLCLVTHSMSSLARCEGRRPGRWTNCPGCRLSTQRCQQGSTWLAAHRWPIWNPVNRIGIVPNKNLKNTVDDVQCSGGPDTSGRKMMYDGARLT